MEQLHELQIASSDGTEYMIDVSSAENKINSDFTNANMTELTGNTLAIGSWYKTVNANTTFILPTPVASEYTQIKVAINLTAVVTIDWGTTVFYNGTIPDVSVVGVYHAYWEYNPMSTNWVCGVIKEGE